MGFALYKIDCQNEMFYSLFSCLIFIDKYQNVGVFLTSFFKSSNPNFYLDLNRDNDTQILINSFVNSCFNIILKKESSKSFTEDLIEKLIKQAFKALKR